MPLADILKVKIIGIAIIINDIMLPMKDSRSLPLRAANSATNIIVKPPIHNLEEKR